MVAEVIAWVFNMITVLVLLALCLALSNWSFIFLTTDYVFDGATTTSCYAEIEKN